MGLAFELVLAIPGCDSRRSESSLGHEAHESMDNDFGFRELSNHC